MKDLTAEKSRKRTIKVTVVWGDSGTGKSTWVDQEAKKMWDEEEIYHFSKVGGSKDSVWFNGYSGQPCLIMDDVWGRVMPYEYMLKILGNDPLDVEVKGGREAALWKEVYITSNYDPNKWYQKIWEENGEAWKAFTRRINRIIHVTRQQDGSVLWTVEKEEKEHIIRDDFKISPIWERTPTWVREERRAGGERVLMRDEDMNALKIREEETPKSEIGLQDLSDEQPDGIADTPGKGVYWGGGDSMYLNYGPLKRGRMEEEIEKEKALKMFIKWKNVQLRGRGLEEVEEEDMKTAIRDGRMKYKEKEWVKILKLRDELERTHDISEEEWSPSGGYHDNRHGDEVEDLLDLVKNWDSESSERAEQTFNSQWWEREHIESIE